MTAQKFFIDKNSKQITLSGQTLWYTHFPFRSLAKIDNAVCSDGIRRSAFITGEPDSFFSIPATVRKSGKWISGYVCLENEVYEFRANKSGKNAGLLP